MQSLDLVLEVSLVDSTYQGLCSLGMSSTAQLPFKASKIPSTRDHEAFNGGTLESPGGYFLGSV